MVSAILGKEKDEKVRRAKRDCSMDPNSVAYAAPHHIAAPTHIRRLALDPSITLSRTYHGCWWLVVVAAAGVETKESGLLGCVRKGTNAAARRARIRMDGTRGTSQGARSHSFEAL